MKTTSLIDRARAAQRTEAPSRSELEGLVADLTAQAAEAQARHDDLAARRESHLVNGDHGTMRAHDLDMEAALFDRDQARSLADRLGHRLAALVADDEEAARKQARAKVEEAMTIAGAALAKYPQAVAAVRGILTKVAEADLAAQAFLRAHPDEPPIPSAEARVRFAAAEAVLRETREIWAWAYDAGRLVPDNIAPSVELARAMRANEGILQRYGVGAAHERTIATRNGPITVSSPAGREPIVWLDEIDSGRITADELRSAVFVTDWGRGRQVWPMRAVRREYEVPEPFAAPPLAAAIRLPPLRPGEPEWDNPLKESDPVFLLEALAKIFRLARTAIRVEIEPLLKT